jgi:hypothetical protein
MMFGTMRTLHWLEAKSRWSQLKSLGGSSIVRASVLMPAFGYILLLNENVHQYLTVKYDGLLLHYLPALWRIWLLFYGSFALAIGTILYSSFCPREIKRYQSSFEMADREADHQANLGQSEDEKRALKRAYALLPDAVASRAGFVKVDVENPNAFGASNLNTAISGMLIHRYTARDLSQSNLRIFILLLFSVGLGLLAIPATFTFVQVTLLALKHIFL